MKRALLVVALAILGGLIFGGRDASWAQQEAAEQQAKKERATVERLQILGRGAKITLHLTDGSTLEGVLVEVHDDVIVVDPKGDRPATTVRVAEIERVEGKVRERRFVGAVLKGAAIVVGALLVVAAATC